MALAQLLLLGLCALCLSSAQHQQQQQQGKQDAAAHPTCKPQGLLSFDHPHPRPRITHGLPVCPQYSCSCCSRQHVAHIYRLLLPALTEGSSSQPEPEPRGHSKTSKGASKGQGESRRGSLDGGNDGEGEGEGSSDDEGGVTSMEWEGEAGIGGGQQGVSDAGMSPACVGMLNTMACRYCDPEVGLGLKPSVCRSTCNAWYMACRNHYFTFEPMSSLLVGCPPSGPGPGTTLPGHEMCVRMRDTVSSGEELCSLAGLPVADPAPGAPCFNGADPQLPEGVCENAPPDYTFQQQQQAKADKKKKGKQKRAGTPVEQAWSAVLLGLLCMLLFHSPKLYKWGRDRFEAWQIRRMVVANAARARAQQQQKQGQAGKGQRTPGAFSGKGRFAK